MNPAFLHGVGDPTTRLAELEAAAKEDLFSLIQVQILRDRCSNPGYWTYPRLGNQFKITRDEAPRHALLRTAAVVNAQLLTAQDALEPRFLEQSGDR
jgi:hypothetical protein